MIKFLKNFGLGLAWIFLLPFIAVAIAVYAIYGAINFIIQFIILLVNFFTGKSFFPTFKEDRKARTRIKAQIAKQNGMDQIPSAPVETPKNVYIQQNFYKKDETTPELPQQQTPFVQIPQEEVKQITGMDLNQIENPEPLPIENKSEDKQ